MPRHRGLAHQCRYLQLDRDRQLRLWYRLRHERRAAEGRARRVASVLGIRAERTRAAGEVRRARGLTDAAMRVGAMRFSTQSTMAPRPSKLSVAGPPAQWFMPGTRNNRAHCAVAARQPLFRLSR